MELRSKRRQDMQAEPALHLGEGLEKAQIPTGVGMPLTLTLREHDEVLHAPAYPGEIVRPKRPDVDDRVGVLKNRVGPDIVIIDADVLLADAHIQDSRFDCGLEFGWCREVGPDVGLDSNNLIGADHFPECVHGRFGIEERHHGFIQHLLNHFTIECGVLIQGIGIPDQDYFGSVRSLG